MICPPPRTSPVRTFLSAPLLLLGLLVGCDTGPSGRLDAWVANEMVVLTAEMPRFVDYTIFQTRRSQVQLAGACNETLAFQLVVDVDDQPLEDLRISISDLQGPAFSIPADKIRIYRMLPMVVESYPPWYLRAVGPAADKRTYYDPLASWQAGAEGSSLSSEPGRRVAFWVDCRIDHTVPPGQYTGEITLTSRSHQTVGHPLQLQVFDVVLPDRLPVAAAGAFDHRQVYRSLVSREGRPFVPTVMDRTNPKVREGLVHMRELMVMAREHRVDLFETALRPVMKRQLDGSIRLDWDDYDAIVTPYLDGSAFADRIGVQLWPLPVHSQWPDVDRYRQGSDQGYQELLGLLTGMCWDHFRQLGAAERTAIWPWRGAVDPAGHRIQNEMAQVARSSAPQLPILSTMPLLLPVRTGWRLPEGMAMRTDILAPPADWFSMIPEPGKGLADPPALAGRWLAPGTPPYLPSMGILASAGDVRTIPWFAMHYGCKGLLLGDVLHWGDSDANSLTGAETRLFYPGSDFDQTGILPSVRLKRLRRGLEDIALLWILRQRDLEAVARSFVESMTRYAGLEAAGDHYLDPRLDGWVDDALAWRLTRELMLREAQLAVLPDRPMAPDERSAMQLRWQQLAELTRALRVERVRARAMPFRSPVADPQAEQTMRIAVRLDLFNQHGRTMDLTMQFASLPEEIQPDGPVRIELPPRTRVEVELTAVAPIGQFLGDGKEPLTVRIDSQIEPSRTLEVQLPLIHAGLAAGKVVIDGKLDDWPMRMGNTASRFVLLGRRGEASDPPQTQPTTVFVLRDAENLYFAFRCEESQMDRIQARPSNIIHYQQLMAVGDDLVEIILDPGQRATGAEGLYHLLIKPNGVLRSEIGIHSDPPLGPAAPWPVPARVAIGREQDAWIVELQLPLSAFPGQADQRFWGVNFTRFRPAGAEATNWAGARRYYYHPLNLGTMVLPDIDQEK
ncbi:MAG: hypothetical protein ACLFUJ_00065 [Phycisphaerae bacterium]